MFGHINARSLIGHIVELKDYLYQTNFDLFAISETWLTPAVSDNDVAIDGFTIIRADRCQTKRGGGVCLYIKNTLKYNKLNYNHTATFEQLWINVIIKNKTIIFGVVYKPPISNCNQFIDNFEDVVSEINELSYPIICVGDFNINMLQNDNHCILLKHSLEAFGLRQLIDEPTRVTATSSSLIDLVLVSDDVDVKTSGTSCDLTFSDHFQIFVCIAIESEPNALQTMHTYRNFKFFNHEFFLNDLYAIPWYFIYDIDSIDDKISFLNNNLLRLFDLHAPLVTITITKPLQPWITDNIKLMIKLRNKAFKEYKKYKSLGKWEYYKSLRNLVTASIRREKRAYLEYSAANDSIKNIWAKLIKSNIYSKKKNNIKIPLHLQNANEINKFFINAVNSSSAPDQDLLQFYRENLKQNITETFELSLVSEEVVGKILGSIKTSARGADQININMLNYCIPHLLPYITHIINHCITNSVFPESWKIALVTPIPKVNAPKDYKDLRPISILSTLSKVLERVIETQLRSYLTKFDLLPNYQSGFRKNHSCATALLNVTDDIFNANDKDKVTALVLIDFSKAFDLLNHEILLAILHFIGISINTEKLFSSYLSNRFQNVIINNTKSSSLQLKSGVPQGSILGPLLYSIYTSHFFSDTYTAKYHLYADDTQLYLSFAPDDVNMAIAELNNDLDKLVITAKKHCLKINASKSTCLIFGKNKSRSKIHDNVRIYIDNELVPISNFARNLGLILDSHLRFKEHVTKLIQGAFCKLKVLYSSKDILNKKLKLMLCDSLILSTFNFCDVVYGSCLDSVDIRRIQKVQNACLRFIYGIRRFESVSHKLLEANWLNMCNRRLVHSHCIYHKIIYTKLPGYLYERLTFRTDVHNVNIRNRGLLTPPLHKYEMFKRSFSYNIYKLYNNTPNHFKTLSPSNFGYHIRKLIFNRQSFR